MNRKWKLYIWNGVLSDYTDGIAFAIARSPEEAKEALWDKGWNCSSDWDGVRFQGEEPKVYDGPYAGFCYGGG
jgi:hypothetical protein